MPGNASGHAGHKIRHGGSALPPWRILCPAWPEAFPGIHEQVRRELERKLLDGNASGHAGHKIRHGGSALPPWRILCPAWPEAFPGIHEQVRRELEGTL